MTSTFAFEIILLHEKGFPNIHQTTHFYQVVTLATSRNLIWLLLKYHYNCLQCEIKSQTSFQIEFLEDNALVNVNRNLHEIT